MAETPNPSEPEVTPPESVAPTIDPEKFASFMDHLTYQQNLPMGVVAGVGAAFLGSVVWAVVTVLTKHQIGWMAVGVGILVGFAVRIFGKGITNQFRFVGAGCALIGCLLGNFLSTCGFLAQAGELPFFGIFFQLLFNPSIVLQMMQVAFHPMDLLFYGIAMYEGYNFSLRPITEEEIAGLV